MKKITKWVSALDDVDPEEDDWGESDEMIPVEPDSDELDDLEELERCGDYVDQLAGWEFVDEAALTELHGKIADHFADRESRRDRSANYENQEPDFDAERSYSSSGDAFNIDTYFSDL